MQYKGWQHQATCLHDLHTILFTSHLLKTSPLRFTDRRSYAMNPICIFALISIIAIAYM